MKKDKLIEIENDERLFDFKFEAYDLPMWAFIRYMILIASYYKLFHIEEKLEPVDCYFPQKEMLKYYLKSAWKTPFVHKQRDIMFMFPAAGDILNADNKYVNRIYGDHFIAAKDKSIIVQSSFNRAYTTPNVDENIRFCDMADIFIKREKGEVSERDSKNIEGLLSFLRENLSVILEEKTFAKAKNLLLSVAAGINPAVKYYKKMYRSVSPKAVVLHCAQYMSGFNPIKTAVAKEMGIKVLEIQHGIVCNTIPPYNFGSSALKNEALLKCLPDYFLLFGDYWDGGIKTPVKCIPIGNPNFYKKEIKGVSVPENTALVLYNLPDSPDKCLSDYALNLAEKLPDYKITYRFHPNVKKSDKIMKKLTARKDLKNLTIDTNIDIYTSLYENEYVVSDESTVLYEAACLKRKVYSLKTEANQNYIDPNMFTVFETPSELVEKIKNKEGIIIDDKTKESIFGSGFPNSYLDFLSEIGIY